MAQPRPLIIPWLRQQIDSGRYPGLVWTNEEQSEFSIPWKHALRTDSSSHDVLIFKAWAGVSGRAQGDASVWKRNFRSALRAKHFTLVDDHKNDDANPNKVYRFPDEPDTHPTPPRSAEASSSSGSQEQDEDICFPTQESQVVPGAEGGIYLAEDALFTGDQHQFCPTGSTIDYDILQQCLMGLNIEPPTECIPNPEDVIGRHALPEQQYQPLQDVIGGQLYPVVVDSASGGVLPEQPVYPIEAAVGGAVGGAGGGAGGGACDQQRVEEFMNMMSVAMDGEHLRTQFNVSVYYRGTRVLEQLVQNEHGLKLVYRPNLAGPVMDPESGLTCVSLPSPGATVRDATQARHTQRILDSLGGGLDVGVSGTVVYGQRRGETRAFWGLQRFHGGTGGGPQEVPKLQPEPLYLFRDFVQGMLEFINGKETCPPCSLLFFLGEKWPDNRPWEKKLVMVEVVLTSLDVLKSIAVEGGASSLQSVELQLSLQESMDMC